MELLAKKNTRTLRKSWTAGILPVAQDFSPSGKLGFASEAEETIRLRGNDRRFIHTLIAYKAKLFI